MASGRMYETASHKSAMQVPGFDGPVHASTGCKFLIHWVATHTADLTQLPYTSKLLQKQSEDSTVLLRCQPGQARFSRSKSPKKF